jgi:hypothetical protein
LSTPPRVFSPEPWTEIIGRVQSIDDQYVVIECVKRFKMALDSISPDQAEKLRANKKVRILFHGDRTVRVREIR